MYSQAGEAGVTFNPIAKKWYHLVTTIDESNKVTNYINGVLMANDFTHGTGIPTWKDDDKPLNIGEWSTHDFIGITDEVAIFNVVLAEKDIKDIMNYGLQLSAGAHVSFMGKLSTTWACLKVR